jgi:hypothetical protein
VVAAVAWCRESFDASRTCTNLISNKSVVHLSGIYEPHYDHTVYHQKELKTASLGGCSPTVRLRKSFINRNFVNLLIIVRLVLNSRSITVCVSLPMCGNAAIGGSGSWTIDATLYGEVFLSPKV